MISSQELDEEVAMVLIEQQEVGNYNPRSWINDMKTFYYEIDILKGWIRLKRYNLDCGQSPMI